MWCSDHAPIRLRLAPKAEPHIFSGGRWLADCRGLAAIRHTSATHLLRSGVDINTIRAWLGHVSVDTTSIYAETDLKTKAKALAHCEIKETRCRKPWRQDKGLMTFLRDL